MCKAYIGMFRPTHGVADAMSWPNKADAEGYCERLRLYPVRITLPNGRRFRSTEYMVEELPTGEFVISFEYPDSTPG